MFHIANNQRNAIQNYNEISPHANQNGYHKKNPQTTDAEEDIKKTEPSHTVGGYVTCTATVGSSMEVS